MNVVDSSGWLEYFGGGPNADFFAPSIEATAELVVPSLSLYEVFKRIRQQRTEDAALQAVAAMMQGLVADLTPAIALRGAVISLNHNLPMADSLMLATAQHYDATFWTQDTDFEHVSGVRFIPKR